MLRFIVLRCLIPILYHPTSRPPYLRSLQTRLLFLRVLLHPFVAPTSHTKNPLVWIDSLISFATRVKSFTQVSWL